MSTHHSDSYSLSGLKAGTEFTLSDHEIPLQPGHAVDPLASEFLNLAAAGEATAIVRQQVAKPEFVSPDGSISSKQLRMFLLDGSNRERQQYLPEEGPNHLTEAALLPVVAWVTGIARLPEQSVEQYFDAVRPENSMIGLVHKLGNPFAEALLGQLAKLWRDGASEMVADSGLSLEQIIKRDPVNVCKLMIRTMSPHEGSGALALGSGLLAFQRICG